MGECPPTQEAVLLALSRVQSGQSSRAPLGSFSITHSVLNLHREIFDLNKFHFPSYCNDVMTEAVYILLFGIQVGSQGLRLGIFQFQQHNG